MYSCQLYKKKQITNNTMATLNIKPSRYGTLQYHIDYYYYSLPNIVFPKNTSITAMFCTLVLEHPLAFTTVSFV